MAALRAFLAFADGWGLALVADSGKEKEACQNGARKILLGRGVGRLALMPLSWAMSEEAFIHS